MLHPGESYTAQTLRKNEFSVFAPVLIITETPIPLWISWGITDRLTAELDLSTSFMPDLADLYRPNPTFNFRYQLAAQRTWKPAVAFETGFQYHPSYMRFGALFTDIYIEQKPGINLSNRINLSWNVRPELNVHASFGASYTPGLFISASSTYIEAVHAVNPDLSVSADWRPYPWMSTHITASYGVTPLYIQHTPRKIQASYSFRFAPFHNKKWGFFRTFRIELAGIAVYFPDIDEYTGSGMLPLFTNIYWQWTCQKKITNSKKQNSK